MLYQKNRGASKQTEVEKKKEVWEILNSRPELKVDRKKERRNK